ncbi:M15 family metallopeptidase [Xanthobacter sp. TB0139]|uniref:M15 family metallopeptidase n=1 Tax=Xanthobacter sp. TB0139 TaxID=3459178 RepID=UPI00403912D2
MAEQTKPPAAISLLQKPDLFVDVTDYVPDLIVDLRYCQADNFVGVPIDGYVAPRALLTRPAALALGKVAEAVRAEGLRVKVFDCYRPVRAVAHFARWAEDLADTQTKPAYYPDFEKKQLFTEGYIASHSGHSRGSTLDMTLVSESGEELDMGTPFDLFSPLSWPACSQVSARAQANRIRLAQVMDEQGFEPFAMEWWHFTLRAEPFPDSYFDFPIE